MTVFVVIPVHNRKNVTRDCLNSLLTQNYNDFKIIVVDDGSHDGTGEMISLEFPQVVLLRGDGNLWWTAAMNQGVQHVMRICDPKDFVLVLNDDLIVAPDYIEKILDISTQFPGSLIGSLVVDINDKNTILGGCVKINWYNAKRIDQHIGKKLTSFSKGYATEVSVLTGRGVLIPVQVFQEIGFFNEKHYKQYGDIEFSRRAVKSGYRLIASFESIVYSQPLKKNNILQSTKYRLKDFWMYYWSIRSNANLKVRFWFAHDTSSNILQGTIFFLCDLLRITVHFFRHLFIEL